MTKNLLYSFLMLAVLVGCKKKDLTPSWLKIEDFTLVTNPVTQGPASHGITDAWIYMDGQALGVFELPCMVPILDEGKHNFIIFAGIKNNGISETRTRYPFYKSYDITVDLVLNDTVVLSPVTSYKDGVVIPFLEDFEDASISLIEGPTSDTDMVFIKIEDYPEIVVYGNRCGGIFLGGSDSIYTGSTQSLLDLPKGESVYLELDFRNNNSISTGVIAAFIDGATNEHTPLVIMPGQKEGQEVWKKIYINLTEDVSWEVSATSYEFYFLAGLDGTNALANIYLDNIKVVHF